MKAIKLILIGSVAIFAVLLLLPTCSSHCHPATPLTIAANYARGIYILVTIEMYTNSPASIWPPPKDVDSSTKYFRAMATNVFRDITPAFLTAQGLAVGKDWSQFDQSMNAWCLNLEPLTREHHVDNNVPVIFTRNLHFTNDQGNVRWFLADEHPFGTQSVVVVTADGSTKKLRPIDLQEVLQHLEMHDIAHILRP